MTDTSKKLIEITAARFKISKETIKPTDDFFEKLKINSVEALNYLSDLEMAFEIEIPDYELQGVKTFEQLAKLIETRR